MQNEKHAVPSSWQRILLQTKPFLPSKNPKIKSWTHQKLSGEATTPDDQEEEANYAQPVTANQPEASGQPLTYAPQYTAYPGSYPPQYTAPLQYTGPLSQVPQSSSTQQQQQQQQIYTLPSPVGADSESGCTACSNADCDIGAVPGGCYRQTSVLNSAPLSCECPATFTTPATPPAMGSEKWKDLPSNRYGDSGRLAISEEDSANGQLTANYETGQVAFELNRFLKHKANGAKYESKIEEIILRDLHLVQPCKHVPGGPGGYRCAVSDDDEGDTGDENSKSPATPEAATGGAKNGVLGLGFLGLKSSKASNQVLAQSAPKQPALTLDQAKKLETQIAVLRDDVWVR